MMPLSTCRSTGPAPPIRLLRQHPNWSRRDRVRASHLGSQWRTGDHDRRELSRIIRLTPFGPANLRWGVARIFAFDGCHGGLDTSQGLLERHSHLEIAHREGSAAETGERWHCAAFHGAELCFLVSPDRWGTSRAFARRAPRAGCWCRRFCRAVHRGDRPSSDQPDA